MCSSDLGGLRSARPPVGKPRAAPPAQSRRGGCGRALGWLRALAHGWHRPRHGLAEVVLRPFAYGRALRPLPDWAGLEPATHALSRTLLYPSELPGWGATPRQARLPGGIPARNGCGSQTPLERALPAQRRPAPAGRALRPQPWPASQRHSCLTPGKSQAPCQRRPGGLGKSFKQLKNQDFLMIGKRHHARSLPCARAAKMIFLDRL